METPSVFAEASTRQVGDAVFICGKQTTPCTKPNCIYAEMIFRAKNCIYAENYL
jgi:hypothetical protein